MAVCIATTAPWIGGSSPSSRVPSSPTRTTAETGWPRSDGPAVKYISSAPGTRMLTLPCPFAEIAPPATTRRAISVTWPARSLSTAHPLACRGQRIPACRCGTSLLLQPDLVGADEFRVTGEGGVDLRRGQPVTRQGVAVPGLGPAPGGLAALPALGARPGLVVKDPAEMPVDLRHGPDRVLGQVEVADVGEAAVD